MYNKINLQLRLMVVLLCAAFAIQALSQTVFTHPWQGKRVAYFGDSITDPRNNGSKIKY